MMPLAPQLSVPHIGQISASPTIRSTMKASKPKLSFSIDSIVGKRKAFESEGNGDTNLSDTELLAKSIKRHLSEGADLASDRRSNGSPNSAGHRSPDAMLHSQMMQQHRQSVSPLSNGSHCATPNKAPHQFQQQLQHQQQQPGGSVSPLRSPSPLSLVTNTHSPNGGSANPLVNGGMQAGPFLSRPGLGGVLSSSSHPALPSMSQTSSAGQMPQVAPLGHPNHPMMVAAAAAAAAASSAAHPFPPMPSDYQQAAAFYPWFLRANPFAGRFPGMPFDSPLGSFLLPPFRKPKRIRTAFSPGQLLKLEQAFEKNHYVVGNERKQLANHLGLSETQVKVWFQNRRTKHKRQKQEDEESGSGSVTNGESGNASKEYSDDEEEIDLEEDEESTTSDQEHENNPANAALKFANMHHLWYQSAIGAGLVPETPVTSANST